MELREDCFERIAHPTPLQGQPAISPTQSEATRRGKQPTDVTPRRGKSWFSGVLNDSVVMLYVCKKIKNKIIPKINVKFEDTLNEYFGIG